MAYPYIEHFKLENKEISITIFSDADASVFNEVFKEREYGILDDIIKNAEHSIIDIGAHCGMFSIYAATLNPRIPIFAYEPEPDNYQHLKENLKKNNITNVHPKNFAIAAKAGKRLLYISPDSHTHTLRKTKKSDSEQIIYTATLEQIKEKVDFLTDDRKCDLLKMDCESAEFEILKSASPKVLKHIKHIYFEYHELEEGLSKDDLIQILQKSKYKVKSWPSPHDPELGFIYAEK